ncbi:hypothetical protein LCGC14_2765120 [marine sediment metagenome]|uniref:Uncharacterized protein n=1 Tax=marine sediment metagenome TaxID=412755 RepID=A0A0F9B6F1_9ZZZZ
MRPHEWGLVNPVLVEADDVSEYCSVIHIDADDGISGTDIGFNGTITNPVQSIVDAITLAHRIGIYSFILISNSQRLLSTLAKCPRCGSYSLTEMPDQVVGISKVLGKFMKVSSDCDLEIVRSVMIS